MTMLFYHGTSEESWKAIQEEGILYGRRFVTDGHGNVIKEVQRCTYLTPMIEEAMCYGQVILEVKYDPSRKGAKNNYIDGCWQVRIYEPIDITDVHRMNGAEVEAEYNKRKEELCI